MSRRKTLVRIVEVLAIALVVLDLTVYFALVRPLRSLRVTEEVRYKAARDRVREGQARVALLEKFKEAVPESETQLGEFLKNYVPERRQGFSRAARLVRELSEKSKVHLTSVSYHLVSNGDDPLARLGLEVEVDGPFPGVMSFAHALETSGELVSLGDFSFEPGEGRTIALRMGAALYLQP
jgi:Tfp pilus assembly protein PilO